MSKRRGATAWLCWMPAFLSGQDVRKLPWSKCFPSMSLPRTGRQTTSETSSLPAVLLLWPLPQMACLGRKLARAGRSCFQG